MGLTLADKSKPKSRANEDEEQSYSPLQKLAKIRCEILKNIQQLLN